MFSFGMMTYFCSFTSGRKVVALIYSSADWRATRTGVWWLSGVRDGWGASGYFTLVGACSIIHIEDVDVWILFISMY